mgnify:CR=1 FL=1
MAVFGLVFVIISLSITGLAIGVILGRAPITGTCAGGTCPNAFKCGGCQQHKVVEEEQ